MKFGSQHGVESMGPELEPILAVTRTDKEEDQYTHRDVDVNSVPPEFPMYSLLALLNMKDGGEKGAGFVPRAFLLGTVPNKNATNRIGECHGPSSRSPCTKPVLQHNFPHLYQLPPIFSSLILCSSMPLK